MHPPPQQLKASLQSMPATGDACCTCAVLLATAPRYTSGSEKPLPEPRALPCCNRTICGSCLYTNARFALYCPYCQTSTAAPPLPSGLRTTRDKSSPVPPPRPSSSSSPTPSPPPPPLLGEKADDTIHHLDHATDTLTSLALAYNVPPQVLRAHNNLPADHLLPARRTLRIPASHYPSGSPSLSPHPVESADEIRRKAALRRFMVACKVADYDVATLYLEQAGHDLRAAVESWEADAAWERAHPQEGAGLGGKGKGKGASRGGWWKML
ncbi:hypothetical protein VD0004_g5870 [Verticillium dahliae]|nr:hypothetical protein VD0004_g5870 [Verticillium dahliae]